MNSTLETNKIGCVCVVSHLQCLCFLFFGHRKPSRLEGRLSVVHKVCVLCAAQCFFEKLTVAQLVSFLPPVCIQSQINPVDTLPSYLRYSFNPIYA
jgi:hypothetical protein